MRLSIDGLPGMLDAVDGETNKGSGSEASAPGPPSGPFPMDMIEGGGGSGAGGWVHVIEEGERSE